MKLSVIIVNYNVKYFLEQCLYTATLSAKELEKKYGTDSCELIVVDNASQDSSVEMIREKFYRVKIIENMVNLGFSKANNQGIGISKGEYVLLLNPDTVVAEDHFVKVIDFMETHPDAGGLGVKMIDGTGKFLSESKRSFPSPKVAFYKIFGLSRLFPGSEKFSKYHLGFLNKDEINQVDVLSGAYMLLRKKTLDIAGLLDEDFFMYGEDIDLSYRITKAGYKNYYFPETEIIHYKGESTKKGSLNYVFMFYNAMIIFAKKHFTSKNAGIYSFIIKSAIWFRAILSVFRRFFNAFFLPVSDAVLFYIGFIILTPLWETFKFNQRMYYPPEYLKYAVPSYILIWIFLIYISGGYKKPLYSGNLFKGILSGTFIILVFYSLLNEEYRYSRALLLLGSAWSILTSWVFRALLSILKLNLFSFKKSKTKHIMIFSDSDSFNTVRDIILNSNLYERNIYQLYNNNEIANNDYFVQIIKEKHINEAVFNYLNYRPKQVISIVSASANENFDVKTYTPDGNSVIGSNSIHSAGEIYVTDINKIINAGNTRLKRISDIVFSIVFIAFFPVFVLLVEKKRGFVKNIFYVLRGKYSWVGYIELNNKDDYKKLPKIKPGILNPSRFFAKSDEELFKINSFYAGNYNLTDDIYIIYKSFYNIGNKKF